MNDVNEHYSSATIAAAKSLYVRYHYRYALFSASGFTADAQQFAAAQQISLVELDAPAFKWLLDAASRTGDSLLAMAAASGLRTFPIDQVREALRRALGTWSADADGRASAEDFASARDRASRTTSAHQGFVGGSAGPPRGLPRDDLAQLVATLVELDGALYFGVTDSPFLLLLQPDDPADFAEERATDEEVRLAFAGEPTNGEWVLATDLRGRPEFLRFKVPPVIESLIFRGPTHAGDLAAGQSRRTGSRKVTIPRTTGDLTLRFVPPVSVERPVVFDSVEISNALRRDAFDPSLPAREGSAHSESRRSPEWSPHAIGELVRLLRAEGWPQAAVIERAARNGGSVTRDEVYEICGYPPDRTLRGFTRPVSRISRRLKAISLLPPKAAQALTTDYGSGVMAERFEVPPEFSRFLGG